MSYLKQTLQHQYSQWFFNIMWLREYFHGDRLRRWATVAAVTLGVIIGLQMLYPKNLALPRTRVSGQYLGFQSRQAITNKVNAYNNRELTVSTKTEKLVVSPKDIGVVVDGTATTNEALEYTWQDRLIPLSWVFTKRHVEQFNFVVQPEQTQKFSQTLATKNLTPVDAKLTLVETNAVVEPGSDGYSYTTSYVQKQVEQANLNNQFEVSVQPEVVEPSITTVAAESTAAQIKQRLDKPITIMAAGEALVIDSKTMASWIVIKPAIEQRVVNFEYDRVKVKNTIKSLSSRVNIAESPNSVIIVDGETTARSPGASGQALLLDASVDVVINGATAQAEKVEVPMTPVGPSTQYVRTYTKTSKGMQALIDYWASTHGGQFGIVVKTADGQIVASHNGGKQFTSASVYKMYIAYVVYAKVKAGTLSLSSVETCTEGMIVHSYNTCAHILGDQIGWNSNDPMLNAKGLISTTLANGGQLTSANDTTNFLLQLNSGSLNGGEYDGLLLDKMKRQVYRFGIPTGAKGMAVANKIGDYGPYQHDVGIVYHPKGTYVISILSSGSSIYQYGGLVRQINQVMDQ